MDSVTHGWNRFFRQFQRDLKLWLFCMLFLSLFRATFIVVFRQHMGPGCRAADVAAAMLGGLALDAMVNTYWILAPLVVSISCVFWDLERAADTVRKIVAVTYVAASTLICCIAVEYYREFDDVFNQFLVNFLYDDMFAVLKTVYSGYHLLPYLLLCAVLVGVGIAVQRRWFAGEFLSEAACARYLSSRVGQSLVNVAIAAAFVVAIRGSIGSRPAQVHYAAVTPDAFLNKAVVNPYAALVHTTGIYLAMLGGGGLKTYLPDENVAAALDEVFPAKRSHATMDDYLEHTAAGPPNPPPRHIFLFIEESYDAWPLLEEYSSLRLTESLRRLAAEGLHIRAFLPASAGSVLSYNAIIAGLPAVSLRTRYEASAQQPYPTSVAQIMRRLGYRTRLFFGGYLSWHNMGDFSRAQGFDEVYGAGHLPKESKKGSGANEWGAHDGHLLEFVRQTVTDQQPSFTVIATNSYHPPYDLDLEAQGFPLKEVPADLRAVFEADPQPMLTILGHLWYADRCLGRFVADVEGRLPRALFAITGDHFGRHFINSHPTFFERSAVPLVLYGKEVLRGVRLPPGVAGSHIDIGPTLVELAAPRGFRYHSFGQNLLAPRERFLGIGQQAVIGPDFLLELGGEPRFHPIAGRPLPPAVPNARQIVRLHHALHGAAWWRIKQGPDLSPFAQVAQSPPPGRGPKTPSPQPQYR